jgi:hypothetical protein
MSLQVEPLLSFAQEERLASNERRGSTCRLIRASNERRGSTERRLSSLMERLSSHESLSSH